MGKWTPDYTDDVLHAKISTLVSGAIRRAAVEKEATASITYENFVTDLDTGDSFTTSLIDILVKEVADRRSRATTNDRDRRLLCDRTVKSLRTLSSNTRVYPGNRRTHARRPIVPAEYLTAPPNELDMDDDDEFDIDNVTTVIEGARVNTDLYEAFGNAAAGSGVGAGVSGVGPSWPASSARRITASPSPVSDDWHPPVRSPTTNQSWSWSSPSATRPSAAAAAGALSRQASIRRAARSRGDFMEYTQRRRSSIRDLLVSPPPTDALESVTEPREGLTPPWNRTAATTSQPTRRFFPFPRPSRRHESASPMWASTEYSDTLSPDMDDAPSWNPPGESWTVDPLGLNYPSTSPDADGGEEVETLVIRAPRMRRGGVRLPETMFSRHASPVIITAENPVAVGTPTPPPPPAARPAEENAPAADGVPSLPASEEPVAYPTPGSTENENLA